MEKEKELKNFLSKLKRTEKKDYCYKCNTYDYLYEDPNIEGLFFCSKCWEERSQTELLEKYGYEEEIPYDE